MNVYRLRANNHHNPLGYQLEPLRLSWVASNDGGESTFQQYARVEISLDESFEPLVFDSGKQEDISSLAFSPNLVLEPRKRYYWRVTVWGDKDEHATSDCAWFETSKLNEPWEGQWITASIGQDTHSLLRKTFTLDKKLIKARAYVCGVGIYEMEINGGRVGEEYLSPGYHAYDYWLQYQTYDVTDMLLSGHNAIGVSLGNGWYKGRFGFDGGYTNLYGDELACMMELVMLFDDGTEEKVVSDLTWTCSPSPVQMSNIYDGEIYDANHMPSGWSTSAFQDTEWGPVQFTTVSTERLQERMNPPIKIMEQIKPKQLIYTPANEWVLDFGEIVTGWVKFKNRAEKFTTLSLQYGEILQNDCFYRDNLRTAKAEYVYISDGVEREVQPSFTFYGFRYVKLEGFSNELELDDFTACVLYSELPMTGELTTSNEDVNQLIKNAIRGQKGNFVDVPTDCPQRDERMGWTGDAQVFVATANYNMYAAPFFNKFLMDLKEEQQRLNGSVPFTVPTVKPKEANGFINGHGSAAWGDAATIIPWTIYQMYGDRYLLKEHYPIMKDWVEYIKREDDESGATRLWQTGFHFGDWLALDGLDPNSPLGGTDSYYIASAYYYYSTGIVAQAAKVLGLNEDYERYTRLAEEVKEAIFKEYFTQTGRIAIYTQTALIVALYMDLVPESMKGRVVADLKKKLKEDKVHLKTGFVGTPYICNVLSQFGLNDEAYTLLLNEDYPSWLYSVKLGATTIWERWNSVLPDGTISGTGMNSLNHYAYGSVVEWMYRYMAGINSDSRDAGFKRIKLTPKPNKRISNCSATYESPFGTIKSEWTITESGALRYCFAIPFNTTAEVIFPDATTEGLQVLEGNVQLHAISLDNQVVVQLTPGNYVFEYQPSKSYLVTMNSEWTMRELLSNFEAVAIFNELAPGLTENPLVASQFIDMPCNEMLTIPLFEGYGLNIQELDERLALVAIKG